MKYSDAQLFLVGHDPVIGELIKRYGALSSSSERGDYFTSLARSIVGQQISVKAATSIFRRLVEATRLAPDRVARLSDDEAKAIGLSPQKRSYIRDLASHFVEDSAVFNHLESLTDDEVITELTRVKGIGVWTAQMFLMFTLHRPDVFAPDDRGLQLAIMKNYDLPTLPPRSELNEFAMRWAPYRSTACFYLWESLDNVPK